ncbi:ABC transporter ATP-binding protein/permease [Pelagibacteraceae bacterium]|nr:ABC transporter ATP-binding protein/permease [Pelagibacteraceae bacterium]
MKFEELKFILKRLYKEYVKKHLNKIFTALALSIVVAASTSGIAWLLDPAVKKIFIEKNSTFSWLIPILIVVAFSGKGISLYIARLTIIRVGEEVSGEIKKQIANNIITTDIETLDSKHSGKYISNVIFDTGQVQNLVSTGVLNLFKDSFSVIALVGLMFYQNWKLALFALLMMPLSAGLAKSLGKRIGKAVGKASDASGTLITFLAEIFRGSRMIRIYQKEKIVNLGASKVVNDMVEKNIKTSSVMIRAAPLMEVLTGIMIAGFIIFSGKLISAGELEVNNFFSFLAAMMLAYQPIRSLATLNLAIFQGATSFQRISKIIDKEIKIKEDTSLPELKVKKSNIVFEKIFFKYETTKNQTIKDINFNIEGGTMAAFVGHSGAGKSTILNLLPRFYDPQSGTIKIDGQDTAKVRLSSLRKNISLVSQDIILFDDTIKNNISYAKDNASHTEIEQACTFAAANEFIEKLPNKFETLIGENGVRLSGGQKQRISIARAILKESPIILLDEATSSLDAESEEIVQNAIVNLVKNKTTLVIAHRLSTIHKADKIFVLKNGEILDTGNHNSLIKNCQEYKLLYEKQLK